MVLQELVHYQAEIYHIELMLPFMNKMRQEHLTQGKTTGGQAQPAAAGSKQAPSGSADQQGPVGQHGPVGQQAAGLSEEEGGCMC